MQTSTRSGLLLERSLAAVWHPCTQMKQHERLPLVPVARGAGCWLYDSDGRRYLDAISSWWVNLFGHCHPRINAALADQLGKLEHVLLAGFSHEPVVELSERLARHARPGALGIALCERRRSGGRIALKMSFHYWRNRGRPAKSASCSLASRQLSRVRRSAPWRLPTVPLFKDTYAPLVMTTSQVASPTGKLCAEKASSAPTTLALCRGVGAALLRARHGKTAASPGTLPLVRGREWHGDPRRRSTGERARRICDRYGVHLIADEIMTGSAAPAPFSPLIRPASPRIPGLRRHHRRLPPALRRETRDAVYQAFYDDDVTRGSSPLALLLRQHARLPSGIGDARSLRGGERDRGKPRQERDALPRPRAPSLSTRARNFRNTGMIWAFEVETADPSFGRRFFAAALDQELLLRPLGNTV